MNLISQYGVRITRYSCIFNDTVEIYRRAVDFFIDVCLREWEQFSDLKYQTESTAVMERLTVTTKNRIFVPYDFTKADKRFYKMPCYLRRSAIAEAYGKVCSY
ncbi:MAG: transposase, partial [Lachnospiraceae bacterium]|nr:transposase [Lachnospiraceae bacterium]